MATAPMLGPADHSREMTFDEFMAGDYQLGYHYELIDGRLYVSCRPEAPEGLVQHWLLCKLWRYERTQPEIINLVTYNARVFVDKRPRVTAPEPDIAAYHALPRDRDIGSLRWADFSPVLVAEIVQDDDPDKDFVRNVELYHQVPSIKEYWLIDPREDADEPSMRVHRRHGRKWRIIELAYGETYTTKLLPGFELCVDPHQ